MTGFQFFLTMTFEGEMGAYNGIEHFWLSILYQLLLLLFSLFFSFREIYLIHIVTYVMIVSLINIILIHLFILLRIPLFGLCVS